MPLYDESVIRNVISASDIVAIISEYTVLTRNGRSYKGCCPFHNEKTGSFFVDPDKGLYNCFGCHKGGNVVRFVMEKENVNFVRAIEILAERAHITLPQKQMSSFEEARLKERKRIYDINKEAANYYYKMLRSECGKEGMKYLKEKRLLSDEILKSFAVGYSPKTNNSLIYTLKSKGFKEVDMEKAGVIVKSQKGNYYDKFFGRVIFPIQDVNDNVIGFGGRIIEGDGAKYMNTAETPVFLKRQNLFALNKAKKSRNDFIILVEGNMDVVSLHEAGFDNTSASLGTALTPEQAKLLKKYTHNVILIYDSDNAGINAAFKAIPLLRDASINVKVLNMIDAKDPDEYIKKFGKEAFGKLLEIALPYIEYELSVFEKRYDLKDSYYKKEFIDAALDRIKDIKDSVDKELYLEKLSDKVRIDIDILKRKLTGDIKDVYQKKDKDNVPNNDQVENEIKRSPASIQREENEKKLISILLNTKTLYNQIKKYTKVGTMETEFLNRLLEDIYTTREKEGSIDMAIFLNHYESLEEQDSVMAIFADMKMVDEVKERKIAEKILKDMRIRKLDDEIDNCKEAITNAKDSESITEITLKMTELIKEKHNVNNKNILEE